MTFSSPEELQAAAKKYLWMHFTRMSAYNNGDIPVIVRGSGPYVYDDKGKRYLDGLAGLFVSMIGHGRTELAEAASKQASELAYFPLWSYAHPAAVQLATRLADGSAAAHADKREIPRRSARGTLRNCCIRTIYVKLPAKS